MVKAVYDNLAKDEPKNHFTVGIVDDVTDTSLPAGREHRRRSRRHRSPASSTAWVPTAPSAPTRTPSRSSATTPTCTRRRYFSYDSKKSGGITISHLRFGKKPIKSTYLIDTADFVACHNPSYVTKYDMVSRAQGRRRLPAQQPLDRRGDGTSSCPLP